MARAFAGPLCVYYGRRAGAAGDGAVVAIAGVEAWRRDLREALAGRVQDPLNWTETPDAPVFDGDLGEAGWMALRLFAFYAERSDLDLPATVPPLLELDAGYRAGADAKWATSRYGQLLACRVWLPADFELTFRAPLPDGEDAEIGSLPVLRDQLRWLDQRTFHGGEEGMAAWVSEPAPAGGELLAAARRGLGALWQAVQHAQRHGLPLVVDEV